MAQVQASAESRRQRLPPPPPLPCWAGQAQAAPSSLTLGQQGSGSSGVQGADLPQSFLAKSRGGQPPLPSCSCSDRGAGAWLVLSSPALTPSPPVPVAISFQSSPLNSDFGATIPSGPTFFPPRPQPVFTTSRPRPETPNFWFCGPRGLRRRDTELGALRKGKGKANRLG